MLGELRVCNFGIVGNDGSILQTSVKANNAREHETSQEEARFVFVFDVEGRSMIRALAKLIWIRTCSITLRMMEGQCEQKKMYARRAATNLEP